MRWVVLTFVVLCHGHILQASLPKTFAPVAEKVLPSVVSILSDTGKDNRTDQDLLTDWSRQGETYGSGFIVRADGMIVTNYHNVQNAQHIWVVLADEQKYPARLMGKDPETDLAVLKIAAKDTLPALQWGSSRAARVGDWILAVGNPLGLQGSVTAGIISAKAREISDQTLGLNQTQQIQGFIQTDAAINVGNSGGPMVNMQGEIIGVNTVIVSPSGSNIGIGFAIPSETAHPIVQQLIETGAMPPRIHLGLELQNITPVMAKYFGLHNKQGALIIAIDPMGPAAAVDIREGDILLAINDTPLNHTKDITGLVQKQDKDHPLLLQLQRGVQTFYRQLPLLTAAAQDGAETVGDDGQGSNPFPFTVKEDHDEEGHTTLMVETSTQTDNGFFPGAQILAINGEDVKGLADYNAALTTYQKTVKPYLFHLQYQGKKYFAALDVA